MDLLHELLEDQSQSKLHQSAKAAQALYSEAAKLCLYYGLPYNTIRVLIYPLGMWQQPRCPFPCNVIHYDGATWAMKKAFLIKGPSCPFGASWLEVEGSRPLTLKSKKQPKRDVYKIHVLAWKAYKTEKVTTRLQTVYNRINDIFIRRWEPIAPPKEKKP